MDALTLTKVYLVGGAVRDKLLNLPITERDWVVVGATPEQLLSQGYQQVGKDFPVFLHPKTKEEYALARTERKSGKGYTGFICDFNKEITLEQDLLRRDLTINAIAMDDKGSLIDPYRGINDIENKILRHVSPAFREDPLRVLRVARFAARFHHLGFKVSSETLLLMQDITLSGEITSLPPERIWKETEKALASRSPQVYFEILEQCGAFQILFPEIKLSNHAKQSLQRSVNLTHELDVRFALLCAEAPDYLIIEELCNKMRIPNGFRKLAVFVNKYLSVISNIKQSKPAEILNLLNNIDVWRNPCHLKKLIISVQAYCNQSTSVEDNLLYQAYLIANRVDVKQIINKGIQGKDIQIELQKQRIEALLDWI